jgi:hypothetical protein
MGVGKQVRPPKLDLPMSSGGLANQRPRNIFGSMPGGRLAFPRREFSMPISAYIQSAVFLVLAALALFVSAAMLVLLGTPLLLHRAITEDRLLHAELPRYRDYASRIRWRFCREFRELKQGLARPGKSKALGYDSHKTYYGTFLGDVSLDLSKPIYGLDETSVPGLFKPLKEELRAVGHKLLDSLNPGMSKERLPVVKHLRPRKKQPKREC